MGGALNPCLLLADGASMRPRQRITWGHGLMQVGVGLRTGTACLAGAVVSALVLGAPLLAVLRRGEYPEPFALLGSGTPSVSVGTWCWQGVAIALAALLLGRAIAMMTAAVGWGLLPSEHRALLYRAAVRTSSPVAAASPVDPVPQVVAHR